MLKVRQSVIKYQKNLSDIPKLYPKTVKEQEFTLDFIWYPKTFCGYENDIRSKSDNKSHSRVLLMSEIYNLL